MSLDVEAELDRARFLVGEPAVAPVEPHLLFDRYST
jgi:hypothetical protein